MRSVWSTAGRARCRGCRAYSTALNTLGRRTTKATGRRKATFAEIFTACYSSIFATAAMVDAFRKEERRNDLDRQLEETRRELVELRTSNASYDSDEHLRAKELSVAQMEKMWIAMQKLYANRPLYDLVYWPPTHSISELIDRLKVEHYGCLDDATLEEMLATDYRRLENQIMVEERDINMPQRRIKLRVHNELDSENIRRIVKRLMFRTHIMLGGTDKDLPSPDLLELRDLTAKRYPYYKFPDDDPRDAHENTLLLNKNIRALMESESLSLREKVHRICFDLLVSKYPPDIHTHNTLIVAFNKAGHHVLAEAMVHSFIRERFLKPTPTTWAVVLNHYKCTHNYGSFMQAIACICGRDRASGGKMGRRHVDDVDKNPRLLKDWAKDDSSRSRIGDWIWMHVPLTFHLLETLFNGLLHFKMFNEASVFFFACLSADIVLSKQCIRALFDHCLTALDLQAMKGLLSGMAETTIWEQMVKQLDSETIVYVGRKLLVIADFCGVATMGEAESGNLIRLTSDLPSGSCDPLFKYLGLALAPSPQDHGISTTARGPAGNGRLATSKSRLLQLEGLWKDLVRVRKTISTIEHRLLMPNRRVDRISLLEHVASSALANSQRLRSEIEEGIKFVSQMDCEETSPSNNGHDVETTLDMTKLRVTEDDPSRNLALASSSNQNSDLMVSPWYGKAGSDFGTFHESIST